MQNLTILNKFIKSLKSKNLFLIALIAGILACALLLPFTANNRAPQAKSSYAPSSDNYVPGEVLLKFKKGTSQVTANSANSKVRATLMKKLQGPSSEIYRVKLPKDVSVENAIDEYMKNPNIEFAEPNYIRTLHATATEYTYLWGINNTGQLVNGVAGTTDADMDVLNFWTASGTTGDSTIIIAVIDTGVLWSHVDLANNIYANTVDTTEGDSLNPDNDYLDDIRGWDFVNHDNDPVDDNGHGSHVAGIIAADGSNAKGMTGVMQDAQILPLKALNSAGTGTTADIVEAINYAVQRRSVHSENVRIINLSLGGSDYSGAEYDAVKGARDAGILVVAAAGNDGTDNDTSPEYPASYELANIISVAATDQTDCIATSGVNGATFSSNYGASSVDVAAPGVNITSTYIASGVSSTYSFLQGTSMAAPHVAGTAGLLWAVNSGWTYTQIRDAIIRYGVDTKLCLNGLVAYSGRVNAEQSRKYLAGVSPIADLATPTGLAATSASSTAINLSWTDTASEDGYNIYRKRCGFACSTYNLVSTVTSSGTSVQDTGLSAGTCYNYHIRAYTSVTSTGGERSDESSEVSATTDPDSPGWPTSSGTSQGQDSGHSRNCFIATAAYGSNMHPYVEKLREFRDRHLLTNYLGRKFVDFYYEASPPIAEIIKDSEFLKAVTRIALTPIVLSVVYPYTSLMVFIAVLMLFSFGLLRLKKQQL